MFFLLEFCGHCFVETGPLIQNIFKQHLANVWYLNSIPLAIGPLFKIS